MAKEVRYYIDVHFYFRICDSWMYGGEGTVGYAHSGYEGCTDSSEEKIMAAYEAIVVGMAKRFQVDQSKIECISKEEYEESRAIKEVKL